LAAAEIGALDPYQLMAELGKAVIHPGGGRSTEELLAIGDLRPGQRVLDAGCGIGTTAAQIARRYDCDVVAVDINEANLAQPGARSSRSASTIAWWYAAAAASSITKSSGDSHRHPARASCS
jgi:ubiquinone/menaquinone biosynthesis C-methylase UbiE